MRSKRDLQVVSKVDRFCADDMSLSLMMSCDERLQANTRFLRASMRVGICNRKHL